MDRLAWAEGLDVPTIQARPDAEWLFWVGCAGSFDPRAQKVARAFARLLAQAGVRYAVLGPEERCTGDAARRLGDEFLFQELAQANVRTLARHKVRRIVTICPHCYNTFKHEYPQFGGNYAVVHHTELLAELLQTGRLKPRRGADSSTTFHDPCYLARVNGQVQAPRAVLGAVNSKLQEMPRHGAKTFCCGAGGGRMWFDEPPAQRVGRLRAREAIETGVQRLATACPFCLNMLTDSIAATPGGDRVRVLDIAEVLLAESENAPAEPGAVG
jgi:Fe-S oxidoreductase